MKRDARRAGVRGMRWFAAGAAVVVVAFALINADLARRGVLTGGDTARYTTGAHNLLDGEALDNQQRLYAGYVALVALADELGIGLTGVVAIQIALVALAALALFDLGRQLAGAWVGLVAAALYITSPDLTRFTGWQSYILTDAPYTSALAIAVWAIHQARVRGGRWYGAGAVVVVLAASLRPQGWWLLPAALLYWVVPRRAGLRSRLLVVAGVAAAFVAVVALAPGLSENTARASPDRALRTGLVIYGSSAWRVSMPRESPSGHHGWSDVGYYAVRHPIASARTAATRIVVETAHIRPFYATRRNAVILAYLVPLYLLATIGLAAHWREPLVQLVAALVALHLALVAVFFADYDGRWLVHVLPLIDFLAALGGSSIARSLSRPRRLSGHVGDRAG
jgi:4-amino-4-deoxy-L-arabinose transferase-like glycosyltransferase